jgi:hypothetical protein
MKYLTTTLSLLAITASLALAQNTSATPPQGKRPCPEKAFKKWDTNADGALSLGEFKARPKAQQHPAKAEEVFKKMDSDNDGKVTLAEFVAHRPSARPPGAPRKACKAGKAGKRGGSTASTPSA